MLVLFGKLRVNHFEPILSHVPETTSMKIIHLTGNRSCSNHVFFCWPQQRSLIILWSDNGLNATSCPRRFTKFEAWATGHVKMHHGNSRRQDICLIFFFAMARTYMKTIIERRSKHWFDYMVPSMCETEPQYNIFLSSQCQAAQVENDTAGCKMRSGCPSQESTSSYFNSIAL